jgi:outer membrane protein assembly factor BamA
MHPHLLTHTRFTWACPSLQSGRAIRGSLFAHSCATALRAAPTIPHAATLPIYKIVVTIALYLLLLIGRATAQSDTMVIANIHVTGNEHTKTYVILREINFQQGDTILFKDLENRLLQNRMLLMNTALFTSVRINLKDWKADKVDIDIWVDESWYIYPLPIFELADRNFNVWWKDKNHSFKRVNFGVNLYHYNLTGNRDVLKVGGQLGYTRKAEVIYRIPYLNAKNTLGLEVGALYSTNKEVQYAVQNNKQLFYFDEDSTQLRRLRLDAALSLRPRHYTSHEWRLRYNKHTITDTVARINPYFLGNGTTQQRYLTAAYRFMYDRRNFAVYATKGYFLQVRLQQDGLGTDTSGVQLSSAQITAAHYHSFGKRWSTELIGRGKVSYSPRQQGYYWLQRALGYEANYVRGYEYYTLDGQHYAYLKSSVRYLLFQQNVNFNRIVPLDMLKGIPILFFVTLNSDWGVAADKYYAQGNPLSNSLLWGGGPGINMVFNNAMVFDISYSWNRLGEGGLYLSLKKDLQLQ